MFKWIKRIKNRKLIRLINIVKSNLEIGSGICEIISRLYRNDKITGREYDILIAYMKENRPNNNFFHNYWWHINDLQSRKDFLDSLLKKLT